MKIFFGVILLSLSLSADAGRNNSCQEFREIKATMTQVDARGINRVLPNAEWLDEKYRRQDNLKVASVIAKTVILTMLKRLSFLSYVFEPTRTGVSSFTGFYVSSPENFVRFLELNPKNACQYLSMNDGHAHTLRELTRDVWFELKRSR